MRELIEKKYRENKLIKFIVSPIKKIYDFYRYDVLDEETYIKNRFKRIFGFELDLNNPKTLNEKIQWLKVNDRREILTITSDKYAVRDYIEKKIGSEYLIPLILMTKNPEDLTYENLPESPFIIKTNHDSGSYLIVQDKNKVDFTKIQKKFKKLLKRNYYKISKEWQYKNIPPKIIVEELLVDSGREAPLDYKFHCMNGEIIMISIDLNRISNHQRNIYSKNWDLLPFTWSRMENNKVLWKNGDNVSPPKGLQKFIPIIEKISEDFKYVRIDFYNINGTFYFGEITHHHGSGFEHITPIEWDLKLGEKLKLN